MTTTDLVDRLLAVRPVIEDAGDGLSMHQNPPSDGPHYLRASLRPFGLLGNVLWLHSDTMQAQLELTDEQVHTLAKMFRQYEREVLGG